MAANYAKIRDGGKGAGLHYRAFEGFSRVVALNLRQLRREDFQIATRIREVGLASARSLKKRHESCQKKLLTARVKALPFNAQRFEI